MPKTDFEHPRHPDPNWWMRHAPAIEPGWFDLCRYCGHVRQLHNQHGCRSRSGALMGDPAPCDCSNVVMGNQFHDPTELELDAV